MEEKPISKRFAERLLVPSLGISALAVAISNTIVTLLILEIASTFQVSVGIATQLRTVNAVGEVVFGLLMGFLVLRFAHKSLLLSGILIIIVTAVGTFFASNLSIMLLFFFLEGIGTVIVTIMVVTIVGDFLPLSKKAKAVSWIVIAGFFSTFAGTPTINFIAHTSNWRYPFLLLVLPISIVGLIFASFVIPNNSATKKSAINKGIYLHNFKQVLLNKSAASCLMANLFFTSPTASIFWIAFLRQHFNLSLELAVYVIIVYASVLIVGSFVTGRFVNIFGSKAITVFSTLASGSLLTLFFFAPNVWIALSFILLNGWFNSMALSAYPCLALDQVPKSRGTMMSLTRLFGSLGSIITPAVGGFLLVFFAGQLLAGYQALGLTLGAMCLGSAGILYWTKAQRQDCDRY